MTRKLEPVDLGYLLFCACSGVARDPMGWMGANKPVWIERAQAFMAAADLEQKGEKPAAAKRIQELESAMQPLLEYAERAATTIDGEWGSCRSLEKLEADGELEPEIIAARAALAKGRKT